MLSIQFCYGDGGDVWAAAWKTIMSDASLQEALRNASASQEMIDMASNALIPGVRVATDYAT